MSFDAFVSFKAITCCSCEATFGLPDATVDRLKQSHDAFSCPICFTRQSFRGKTKEEREIEALRSAKRTYKNRSETLTRQLERERARAAAYKGHFRRVKEELEGIEANARGAS
jgi:predicted  nucleic acid-binding Zn-ribbon protein